MQPPSTPSELPPPLQQAARVLAEVLPHCRVAYAFGSRANGLARAASDLDLAILLDEPMRPIERFERQERIATALGLDVDLVDLRQASLVLRRQVVVHGRLLFDSDPEARHRFEMYTLAMYDTFNLDRRPLLADIRARGSIYGP